MPLLGRTDALCCAAGKLQGCNTLGHHKALAGDWNGAAPYYLKLCRAGVRAGCENLRAHIATVRKAGVTPVVCLNAFHTDTPAEHRAVRRVAEEAGARFAVSNHWLRGGDGARELAEAVVDAAAQPADFRPL